MALLSERETRPLARRAAILRRVSAMSLLRMVSWPMRSCGVKVDVALLHRQPLGVVGQIRRVGVEDRVVVAAAQTDRDLAGDEPGHPALQRLAQHHRLRIEPAALVEEPAEAAAAARGTASIVSSLWMPLTSRS